MRAEIPGNEVQRLAALRDLDVLDTLSEPEFDELVALAAAICETPMGLVSLVDRDRQWFKAAVGFFVRETPRDLAFCAHAILQKSVFLVEDATSDQRFADNPLVTGQPNIRFYAGIPLSAPGGLPIGTLCVLDTAPRQLTVEQRSALEILGRQVTARLELRSKHKELQRLLEEKQEMLNALTDTKLRLEQANHRLEELAATDVLTGLWNRRFFDERLAEEYKRAQRRGTSLCVAMLDIDNFKKRNDIYGHAAGDLALQQFATILRRSARQTDLTARYGGEEFAILLTDSTLKSAQPLMTRIMTAVHSATWRDTPLTVSIGLAQLDTAVDCDGSCVIRRADLALYAAKKAGRDRLCCS